ncbi:hypothetical protein HOI71_18410 [Candidatus Poribacteria bacterium]|nr:hypothetical protein [Candidatus Poribacteria bacterium]
MRDWTPTEPDFDAAFARSDDPMLAMCMGEIPAVVLRGAYDAAQCPALLRRFTDMGLMRDAEGLMRGEQVSKDARSRIDIGTSLGNRGADKERFLQHAEATHHLFSFLFDGYDNPVDTIYDALARLSVGKTVKTAEESDGQRYGPAIFRVHYEGHTYKPHIDHIQLREGRLDYAVHRYQHQFAGVLCLQNYAIVGTGTEATLHDCLWTPEIQPHIAAGTFPEYAEANDVGACNVALEVGDLYFFNTQLIHEVPAVKAEQARIVLAVFIGYDPDMDEVFVWS